MDKWQKCCMDSGCDPASNLHVCIIMPFTPYLALLFFMSVVGCCAVFEWALIGNKLCFKNPPKDEDPFALVSGAAEAARKSTAAPKKKAAKPGAVAPEGEGAGALE